MKIAICWAHWVWKTTISKEISKEYNLEILPDIVVQAHNMGLQINESTPLETQVWLIWQQMANEKTTTKFIADKCIFDYYIYAKALCMDDDLVNVAYKMASKTGKYDYIFYIPPEFPIEDDGVRSTDKAFQSSVDKTYKEFLDKEKLDYCTITWSVNERVSMIREYLNN